MYCYKKKLKNDHILFTAENDIIDICKPLLEHLEIGYFHFRRTYKDGSYLILSTNSNWPLYFIEKNIPVKTPISQKMFNSNVYFCMWKGHIPDETLSNAKKICGITNAITIVKIYEEFFDSYSFSSKINHKNDIDCYINNFDVYLKFTSYFQEKSEKLIKDANKQIIVPPIDLKDLNIKKIINLKSHDESKKKLINSITVSPNSLKTKTGTVILTKRESECLHHLSQGKNRKEIARLMQISVRTVDTHLEKSKNKLSCFTNAELVDLWWTNQ